MSNYHLLVAGVAALIFVPAVLAGVGFYLALIVAGIWLLSALGGPKLWELIVSQQMGSKGRSRDRDVRDLISGDRK